MIPLRPDTPDIQWAGAVSLERRDGWIRAWRIPHEQFDLFPPGGIGAKARESTGVRLVFLSNTRSVELAFFPMEQPANADLVCDDELICTAEIAAGQTEVRLDGAPSGMRRLEVWLPRRDFRLRFLRVEKGAAVERCDDRRPRWTAYGSSITECAGAYSPARTWPAIVARRRQLNLTCLGFGGNCHAEPMVARLIRDIPADLISLSIGINIQGLASLNGRTFQPAIIGFVEIIRDKQPDVPIVLVSPIVSPPRETQRNVVGLSLKDMREQIAEAADLLVRHGAGPLHYVDGLKIMGPEEAGYLPDELHPNAEGYLVYAENYLREVMSLVTLPAETSAHT